jgi:uncharacterized RDD family membrane protein YckC
MPTPAAADLDTPPARALVWRRLLAMAYDLWPVAALWFALSLLANVAYTLAGHDARAYVAPFTLWGWLLWCGCWLLAGLYATASWARGGQTLGMRPWRLRLVAFDGGRPPRRALWIRFAVGTLSLLAAGAGFWWAWIDRDRLAWHDRASRTRLVLVDRRPAP